MILPAVHDIYDSPLGGTWVFIRIGGIERAVLVESEES